MNKFEANSKIDKLFVGGLVIKGATGLLEFLSGLLLIFISPQQIHHFINFLTQKELVEDPQDIIVKVLIKSTEHLNNGDKMFLITYLWVHAVIKLVAVIGILKNQLWAYPFSMITLGGLMIYQLYSIVLIKFSIGMLVLTIFDIFILTLIFYEYKKRKEFSKIKNTAS